MSLPDDAPCPRLCHLIKWPDFEGYGFNLHAEKTKQGQFIGKVDPDSPAMLAGLMEGDKIIEVNFVNICNENHRQVVERIKSITYETRLLVIDEYGDRWYRERKMVIKSSQPNVIYYRTPVPRPPLGTQPIPSTPDAVRPVNQTNNNNNHHHSNNSSKSTTPTMDKHNHNNRQQSPTQSNQKPNNGELNGGMNRHRTSSSVSSNSSASNQNNNNNNNHLDKQKSSSSSSSSQRSHTDSPVSNHSSSSNSTTNNNNHVHDDQSHIQKSDSLKTNGTSTPPITTSIQPPTTPTSITSNNSSSSSSTNNNENGLELNLNMTAAQMRQLIAQRKKKDIKQVNIDLRKKYEIIQQM